MYSNELSLDEIANKYNTDKGTSCDFQGGRTKHGYAPFYDNILSKWRNDRIKMLEIGVCMEGTDGGHSIYMWREYFKNALIFTFDIVDMSQHPAVVNNDNVFFYRGDQGNKNDFISMHKEFGNPEYDFILEDGSHTTEHQIISLAHLFQYVKSGGYYIMEDVSIPGNPVCCIRNDETYEAISSFKKTLEFNSNYVTDIEKKYLEDNISSIEIFEDMQNAYVTIVFTKK